MIVHEVSKDEYLCLCVQCMYFSVFGAIIRPQSYWSR